MGNDCPGKDDIGRIRKAADAVLNDAVFERSPVLSRLLTYLVEMTATGSSIKSYTIAIDGLGKSHDDLNEADTYARVAVARLRKALSVHYADKPGGDEIYVDTGSYMVRIRSNPELPPAVYGLLGEQGPRRRWPRGKFAVNAWIALAAVAALLLVAFAIHKADERQKRIWSSFNLPTLSVVPAQAEGKSDHTSVEIEMYRQALLTALGGYAGLRVIDDSGADTDFRVKFYLSAQGTDPAETISLVERKSGRMVWSSEYSVKSPEDVEHAAMGSAFAIASPSGALHGFARRAEYDVQSPYGCWLRFTEGVQTYNTLGDAKLAACAEEWYTAAERRPLAAFLYGWTLADRSVAMLRQAERKAALEKALAVVHRALALNPDFAVLHIAEMRAYSLLGDRRETLQSARDAIEDARHNRLIIGMAATGMVFWNDPEGEVILSKLHQNDNPPLPWEHVGRFIAAMMREDVTEAGKHIYNLRDYEAGQPFLLVLEAAYAKRIGNQQEAEAALAELKANRPVRIAGTTQVVDRLPLAPEVKARLKQWLSGAAAKPA